MKLRLLTSLETTGLDVVGRPLAVVDADVQIAALFARREGSSNVRVVEAAISGLYVCVLSDGICSDVIEAMSGEKLGRHTAPMVEALLSPLWSRSRMVEMAEPDSVYSRAVRDPDDEILLRTAGGAMQEVDLATLSPRFIVTNNVSDIRGSNFFGFEVVTAHQFWLALAALAESKSADQIG